MPFMMENGKRKRTEMDLPVHSARPQRERERERAIYLDANLHDTGVVIGAHNIEFLLWVKHAPSFLQ